MTDVPKTFSKTKANWSTLNSSSALALPETTPQSTAPAVAKRKGGLVSKEELDLEASQKAEERRQEAARIEREREERRRVAREAGLDEDAAAEETVYRDREGRKVDIRAERDEEARKMQEEKRAERERKEWSKGLIQRQEAERRRETEAKMRSTAVARRADDREMNEELRAEQRAEDPAAAFLTVSPSHLADFIRVFDPPHQSSDSLSCPRSCSARKNVAPNDHAVHTQPRPTASGSSLAFDGMESIVAMDLKPRCFRLRMRRRGTRSPRRRGVWRICRREGGWELGWARRRGRIWTCRLQVL